MSFKITISTLDWVDLYSHYPFQKDMSTPALISGTCDLAYVMKLNITTVGHPGFCR